MLGPWSEVGDSLIALRAPGGGLVVIRVAGPARADMQTILVEAAASVAAGGLLRVVVLHGRSRRAPAGRLAAGVRFLFLGHDPLPSLGDTEGGCAGRARAWR